MKRVLSWVGGKGFLSLLGRLMLEYMHSFMTRNA